MKVRRLYLLFMLALFVSNIQAQSNFIKSTVINNNNDTIQGYIDYKNWEVEPKSIVFKKKLQEPQTILLPTQIKTFIVGGDIYETHKIKLETDLKDPSMEETVLMGFTTSTDTTVFLRCHVRGYWNMYSRTTGDGKSALYINKENDTLQLLKFRRAVEVRRGNLRMGMKEGYKSQLLDNFKDYQVLYTQIVAADYQINPIQSIIIAYNKRFLDKKSMTYIAEPQKGRFELHILAGGNYSFLSIASTPNIFTNRYIDNQTIKGHGFDFGVSAQWFLPRRFNKASFLADFTVKTMRLFNSVTANEVNTQTQFNNSYLRLYVQHRYEFYRTKRFALATNGGFVFSHSLNKENNFTKVYRGNTYSDLLFPKDDYKKYNLGFTAGLICRFNKALALEFRGESNRGMSPYVSISSRLSSINALLYYRLK